VPSVCFASAVFVNLLSSATVGLWSTSPIVFAQSYEYGQLCEIKPKLERWYGEEQGLRKCAIADNLGFLSV